jgi:hypothetical protein
MNGDVKTYITPHARWSVVHGKSDEALKKPDLVIVRVGAAEIHMTRRQALRHAAEVEARAQEL